MKKLAVAIAIVAFVASAHADPRLIGQWKSDADLSMKFNREHAKLEDKTLVFLEHLFGHLTITFTAGTVTTSMPNWESQTALGVNAPMVGFTETHPYKRLGSSRTEVAVSGREPVTGLRRITVYNFEGDNTMWVYLGGENFPALHVREYFARVR